MFHPVYKLPTHSLISTYWHCQPFLKPHTGTSGYLPPYVWKSSYGLAIGKENMGVGGEGRSGGNEGGREGLVGGEG